MSCTQFHRIKMFILRHAWLNLWNKHMTTGRINQVTFVWERKKSSQQQQNWRGSRFSHPSLLWMQTDQIGLIRSRVWNIQEVCKKQKPIVHCIGLYSLARNSNATRSVVSLCSSSALRPCPRLNLQVISLHNQREHKGSHRKRTNTPLNQQRTTETTVEAS
jgi:hypothetical protein